MRQPEARLALARLYERYREYNKAAVSYQHYLGLMPNLPEKDKQHYQRKITRLQELAAQQQAKANPSSAGMVNTSSTAKP